MVLDRNFSVIQKVFLVLVFGICLKQFIFLMTQMRSDFSLFVKAKGDYQDVRNFYPAMATASQVKKLLPSDAIVTVAPAVRRIDFIAAAYTLYPIRLIQDLQTEDTLQQEKTSDNFLYIQSMTSGAIPENQHSGGLKSGSDSAKSSPLKRLVVFTSLVCLEIAIGFLVLNYIQMPFHQDFLIWSLATAFLIGFSVWTCSLWLYLLALGHVNMRGVLFISGLITGFLAVINYKKQPLFIPIQSAPNSLSFRGKFLKMACIGVLATIVCWLIATPVNDWDTMQNWMIKSKAIFHHKGASVYHETNGHAHYPMIWPLNIGGQYLLLGEDDDALAKWTSAVMFVVFIFQLRHGLKLLGMKNEPMYFILLLYMGLFCTANPFNTALPENAFLAFLTAMLVVALHGLKRGRGQRFFLLIAILAASINLLKLEGFIVTCAVCLSLGYLKFNSSRSNINWKTTALIFSTTLLPFAWAYWVQLQSPEITLIHWQSNVTVLKLMLLFFSQTKQMMLSNEWLVFLMIVMSLRLFAPARAMTQNEKFLLITFTCLYIFKWLAMIGWSNDMLASEGIFPDGVWRLFLHTTPALALYWGSRLWGFNHE